MGGPVAGRPGSESEAELESESEAEPPVTDAVLLCGGRGTRLGGDVEKPLVEVGGRPMIGRVFDALAGSRIRRVVAVSSPYTPATTAAIEAGDVGPSPGNDTKEPSTERRGSAGLACDLVGGDGDGYVDDLDRGLDAVDGPALTVTSDLPLVRPRDVDDAIAAAVGSEDGDPGDLAADRTSIDSVAVCVPVSLKRELGASVDTSFIHDGLEVAPTGLNVVGGGDDTVVVRRSETLAVNVNRPQDLELARRLASEE